MPADWNRLEVDERSHTIATYALCGFANIASVAIQVGGIGSLAPNRRGDMARLGIKAMIGGLLACCLTACIAGIPLQAVPCTAGLPAVKALLWHLISAIVRQSSDQRPIT